MRGWLFSAASSRLHTTDCQGVKCVQLGYVLSSRNGSELSGFGWPDNAEIEKDIAAWYDAKSIDDRRARTLRNP